MQNHYKKIFIFGFILIIFVISIFLSGCVQVQRKQLSEQGEKEFSIVYDDNQYTPISSEEAALLGFVVLPYPKKQSWYKKNDMLYSGDFYYDVSLKEFNFQLLKQLYIDSGWVFIEEVVSSHYVSLIFKKINKDLILFVESVQKKPKSEKKTNISKKNNNKVSLSSNQKMKFDEVILHQTMILNFD